MLHKLVNQYNGDVEINRVKSILDNRLTKLRDAINSKDIKAVLKERNELKDYIFNCEKRIRKYKDLEINFLLVKSLEFIQKSNRKRECEK